MMYISALKRELVNSLEDIQNWLKQYCNLKVSIKCGYFCFSGDNEYTVMPTSKGFYLYWNNPSMDEFFSERDKFYSEENPVEILKLGAEMLIKWGKVIEIMSKENSLSDDNALLNIHLHYIKSKMKETLDTL